MKLRKVLLTLGLLTVVSLMVINNVSAMGMGMPMHDPSDGVGSDCMLTDVTGDHRGNATACFSHLGNDSGAMGALLPHLNEGIFGGITTWVDQGDILGSAGPNGTWSLPGGFTSNGIVLSVKSSPEFRAYYLPGGILENGGTWLVKDGQDLSHLKLVFYTQGPVCPDVNNPNCIPAPEPGTILLFGSGLAGLGLWRWKTKK